MRKKPVGLRVFFLCLPKEGGERMTPVATQVLIQEILQMTEPIEHDLLLRLPVKLV